MFDSDFSALLICRLNHFSLSFFFVFVWKTFLYLSQLFRIFKDDGLMVVRRRLRSYSCFDVYACNALCVFVSV